ncbi:GSCFA domain-containing protein [Orrella sp. JC864]|uniref:GSCFA domain-containing protein n=1 Tax=Orrella sp. JC864 TaxID=3120298 RepID=UPI003009CC4B
MSKKSHFYTDRPDYTFWRKGVSQLKLDQFDPVVSFPFRIEKSDKVATAGSCFAQHISRHMSAAGFTYLVTETAHPIAPPELAAEFSYGTFTARFGNLYTARQLAQLFDRAYGTFSPKEDAWTQAGRWFDPFRPGVEPGGFATETEYLAHRRQHFAAVRRMFEELDYFVFTLGLTECWVSAEDGAAFPVCPGTIAGEFDPARHKFVNFEVEDVVADLGKFLSALAQVNPKARMILTVSPVPLMATAEDRHVAVSTTLSKAILRVAAERIVQSHGNVAYFPSYEIITANLSRGRYYAPDLRSVTEQGVKHVMRLFLKHAAATAPAPARSQAAAAAAGPTAPPAADTFYSRAQHVVDVICDEEALDRP